MPEVIVCDFCLKRHGEEVLLVENALRTAHVCEYCIGQAQKLIAERKKCNLPAKIGSS